MKKFFRAEAVLISQARLRAQESAGGPARAFVKIIAPGWGSSGYYGAEMLAEFGEVALPIGTRMFWNHPTLSEQWDRPERDLNYLAAGFLSPAVWMEEGPEGAGLYAEVEVFSDYSTQVKEKAKYSGVSIFIYAESHPGEAEGQNGEIIDRLFASPFNSVDFVTVPGAGGMVATFTESERPDVRDVLAEAARRFPLDAALQSAAAQAAAARESADAPHTDPPKKEELQSMTPEEIAEMKAENERLKAEGQRVAETHRENETLKTQIAEAALKTQAQQVAREKLAGYSMPQALRDRVRESVAPIFKDENGARVLDVTAYETALQEAAKSEVKFAQEAYGWGTGDVNNGDGGDSEPKTDDEPKCSTVVESARAELGL